MFEATAISVAERAAARRREQVSDPVQARQRRFARRDRWDDLPGVLMALAAGRLIS